MYEWTQAYPKKPTFFVVEMVERECVCIRWMEKPLTLVTDSRFNEMAMQEYDDMTAPMFDFGQPINNIITNWHGRRLLWSAKFMAIEKCAFSLTTYFTSVFRFFFFNYNFRQHVVWVVISACNSPNGKDINTCKLNAIVSQKGNEMTVQH